MPVRMPAARAQINLHIPRARRLGAQLHHRPAKIRSALHADEARMPHAHRQARRRLELVPPQPLMLPDGLQHPFGRAIRLPGPFPQRRRPGDGHPSPRIKTVIGNNHAASYLPESPPKSSAGCCRRKMEPQTLASVGACSAAKSMSAQKCKPGSQICFPGTFFNLTLLIPVSVTRFAKQQPM